MSPARNSSSRRVRVWLALSSLLLIALAWLYFTDAAGISGMRSEQMDWDGDGTVTGGEIAQAFYAVSVRKNEDGPRTCKTYYWRRGGETIRVECKTTFAGDPE